MRKAIHFGAGNIGRGFLGQLYYESGYHTTFVDVVQSVVDGLNRDRAYPLRIVGEENRDIQIQNVSAVHGADIEAVAAALEDADIASTAVGVNVLAKIAPALAAGITKRFTRPDARPLDIIVCENLIDAGPYLRDQVLQHLAPEWHDTLEQKVGFVEASIGRMVPVMTEEQKTEHPLLVLVEPYCELPVDKHAFKGAIPDIVHLSPRDNFGAYVERKLYVHNSSHAATAYFGFLHGHTYVYQAIADPWVREAVSAALEEASEGMIRKHGMDRTALWAHCEDIIARYANVGLGDKVARVANDPIRKLGPNDRLIGAALMCLEQNVTPVNLALAAAAAIRYDHPDDTAAQEIQTIRRRDGLEGVLRDVCRLSSDSPLVSLIRDGEARLMHEGVVTETT